MSSWQNAPARSKSKRAFIGNLNNHPNTEEKLRALLSRSAITIRDIEIVPLKQPNTKCYALVQCDVGMAIKCLNGIRFDGNVLSVKSEKKQNNGRKKKGIGFGGGWAAPKTFSAPATQKSTSISRDGDICESQSSKESHSQNPVAAMLSAGLDTMALEEGECVTQDSNKADDVSAFRARCKISLNNLMEEYGAFDPNYEKMKAQEIKPSHKPCTSPPALQRFAQESGMLAPNGKAPIHIEIVSFGFKYSVPPAAREGWSHSNPLSPIDCRDLPRCPHYVAKLSGLSHKVKRAMLSIDYSKNDYDEEGIESDDEVRTASALAVNPLLAKSDEVSRIILGAMEEAINDGGHGYAFPLQTEVYLGSEYGRHRSVVLCEKIAQNIRSLLRTNDGNRISQPVSVSTRHRDVDQKHKDEEAFGTDLRREHDAEVKRKKKQEWLESRW